jgi:hypothetical protein
MLRAGLAWHYKYYERDQPAQDRDVYSFEEGRVSKLQLDFWFQTSPTLPWDFRRGESRQKSTADIKPVP